MFTKRNVLKSSNRRISISLEAPPTIEEDIAVPRGIPGGKSEE
jgi:hypothetical protein